MDSYMKEADVNFTRKVFNIVLSGTIAIAFVPTAYADEPNSEELIDKHAFEEIGTEADSFAIEELAARSSSEDDCTFADENPYEAGTEAAELFEAESIEKSEYYLMTSAIKWNEVVEGETYQRETVLIGLRFATSDSELDTMLDRNGLELVDKISWNDSASDGESIGKIIEVRTTGVSTVEDAIKNLYQESVVVYAEPDWAVSFENSTVEAEEGLEALPSSVLVNDPYVENQWYLDAVHAQSAWDISRCNGQVSVAVFDSGIDLTHPDLNDNIDMAHAWDATGTYISALDGDIQNHGTRVSGVVSAEANNAEGIAGVSYNAKIIPIRISKNVNGRILSYSSAVYRAIRALVDAEIPTLRIINYSYGSLHTYNATEQNAINLAHSNNIAFVCSAGNDSANYHDYYSSNYKHVISVVATDNRNLLASFSNYGSNVDVAAPGKSIYTTNNRNLSSSLSYVSANGTSYAAPVVSGVLALMFAYDPALSVDSAEVILKQTATHLGEGSGFNSTYGWGLVNAHAALEYLEGTSSQTSISHAIVMGVEDTDYTGAPIEPNFTVTLNGNVLRKNIDYTVSYNNNVNPRSNAEIIIRGVGSYCGMTGSSFYIKSKWERLLAQSALGTMRAIVYKRFDSSCDAAIVTTIDGHWDALTANGLAGLENCPVLMTAGDSLSGETSEILNYLSPSKVYVLGGTLSISESVEESIRNMPSVGSVRRISGNNARDTAVEAYRVGKTIGQWGNTALVATSETFQDALSASPYAYNKNAPIFLTNSEGVLDASSVSSIKLGKFTRVILCGGEVSISPWVETQLTGIPCTRLSGANCYGTSLAVANWCLSQGMSANQLAAATGEDYHDAVCGAAFCGKNSSVLILVSDNDSSTISGFVRPQRAWISRGYILGGEASVPFSTEIALNDATLP